MYLYDDFESGAQVAYKDQYNEYDEIQLPFMKMIDLVYKKIENGLEKDKDYFECEIKKIIDEYKKRELSQNYPLSYGFTEQDLMNKLVKIEMDIDFSIKKNEASKMLENDWKKIQSKDIEDEDLKNYMQQLKQCDDNIEYLQADLQATKNKRNETIKKYSLNLKKNIICNLYLLFALVSSIICNIIMITSIFKIIIVCIAIPFIIVNLNLVRMLLKKCIFLKENSKKIMDLNKMEEKESNIKAFLINMINKKRNKLLEQNSKTNKVPVIYYSNLHPEFNNSNSNYKLARLKKMKKEIYFIKKHLDGTKEIDKVEKGYCIKKNLMK